MLPAYNEAEALRIGNQSLGVNGHRAHTSNIEVPTEKRETAEPVLSIRVKRYSRNSQDGDSPILAPTQGILHEATPPQARLQSTIRTRKRRIRHSLQEDSVPQRRKTEKSTTKGL